MLDPCISVHWSSYILVYKRNYITISRDQTHCQPSFPDRGLVSQILVNRILELHNVAFDSPNLVLNPALRCTIHS